jgi:protein required for attachment to host cells
MKRILLVVANASRARIYQVHSGQLEVMETLQHPASRARASELVSDRPGRAFDDNGGGGPHRSSMTPPTDPHEVEMLAFAREVGRRTSIQARRGRFPELLLFAPPRFLGRLKAAIDPVVARRIVASVSHDYTSRDDPELATILEGFGVRVLAPRPA